MADIVEQAEQPTDVADCAPRGAESLIRRTVQPVPTPIPRRYNLRTMRGVRAEMAAVYRSVRRGDLDSSEGARLIYMLVQLAKVIEVAELEARVAAIEALAK